MPEVIEYSVLALDAMGFIDQTGDDVADLLTPFIAVHSSSTNRELNDRYYLRPRLGEIPAMQFWRSVDIDPALEDSCLCLHRLTDGSVAFRTMSRSDQSGYGAVLTWSGSSGRGSLMESLASENLIGDL